MLPDFVGIRITDEGKEPEKDIQAQIATLHFQIHQAKAFLRGEKIGDRHAKLYAVAIMRQVIKQANSDLKRLYATPRTLWNDED